MIINFPANGLEMDGTNIKVTGCFIGIGPDGETAAGNAFRAGCGGVAIGGFDNIIGGPTPAERNIISGNLRNGIAIGGPSDGFIIQGNFIGTNASGTAAVENPHGVSVGNASNIPIGGSVPGSGNLISGNGCGICLYQPEGESTHHVRIEGNLIGTDVSGGNPIPNGAAISISGFSGGPWSNLILENVIAFNGEAGIAISTEGQGEFPNATLSGNAIYRNVEMGVDLRPSGVAGVTPNDPGDVDTGPNGLMNFPVLTSAQAKRDRLIVKGSIDTADPRTVVVEFFANEECDPSGHGEGQTPWGTATPNVKGKLTATLQAVPVGYWITATATDADGNTSEFSACIEATPPGKPG